jgi:hypothetical protein
MTIDWRRPVLEQIDQRIGGNLYASDSLKADKVPCFQRPSEMHRARQCRIGSAGRGNVLQN